MNTAEPKYLTCNFRHDVELQTSHTEYQDEGSYLLKKLVFSKWRTNTSTTRTTALAMCYSIAEYVAPVWARSSHTDILHPKVNKA